jgi:hypothetical protein
VAINVRQGFIMAEISDEDRLIRILQLHKALKLWTINLLSQQGIACQETYGNDEKGDIIVLKAEDVPRVQQLLAALQMQFNDRRLADRRPSIEVVNPHLEIKTQYLYGKEVELIIQQGTVVGIVSASNISQPSRLKLNQAGIAYADNVPLAEFTDELSE